jgi:osmotically-inducible protein OsmY
VPQQPQRHEQAQSMIGNIDKSSGDSAAATKTDSELQIDVLDELKWRPSLDAAHVCVTVMNGVVTLSGQVATHAQKLDAEAIARRVHGVLALADALEVDPLGESRRDDSEIARAALLALKWDSEVPNHRLSVDVRDGCVTLGGVVTWQYQKVAAEHCIGRLMGVVTVANEIVVRPGVMNGDVASGIRAAFIRNAVIDARRVSANSVDGDVTLTGSVSSWAERDEAVRATWAAPGVTGVVDGLTVIPLNKPTRIAAPASDEECQ